MSEVFVQYRTKHSKELLDYMMNIPGQHITAQEVCEYFKNNGNPMGLATVYRQLERLVSEGLVQKYNLEGASACFEYIGQGGYNHDENCFHCKCIACGKLIHLECEEINHLKNHILADHNFTVDTTRTVFYGLCENCRH